MCVSECLCACVCERVTYSSIEKGGHFSHQENDRTVQGEAGCVYICTHTFEHRTLHTNRLWLPFNAHHSSQNLQHSLLKHHTKC